MNPRRNDILGRLLTAAVLTGVSTLIGPAVAAPAAGSAVAVAVSGDRTDRPAVAPPRIEDGRMEPPPPALQDIGIDEQLGQTLPLDLPFRDEDGRTVRLGDYLNRGRPVLLQLAYYDCPMLCDLVAEGMLASVRGLPPSLNGTFDVLTVSISAKETPSRAKQYKQETVRRLGRPPGAVGWDFLVGDERSITLLSEAVGFRFKFIPSVGEYSHPAAIMVLTPGGTVSNYLYGVAFEPKVLEEAIRTAGEGRQGSPMRAFILTCFQIAHSIGQYSASAMGIMRLAGVATVLGVVGMVGYLLARERPGHLAGRPAGHRAGEPMAAGSKETE